MKILLALLLITNCCFGQVTVKELIAVSKMDSESFEIYALKVGFSFYELITNNIYEGMVMTNNGDYGNERYLVHYSKYYNYLYSASYQTGNSKELLSIYEELKLLGFELKETGKFEDFYTKEYTRGYEQLSIYIKPDWIDISYHSNK